jgi:hypothetical protein
MGEYATLTEAEWQDLREQVFVLLDVTWDYSVNVATLDQISVKRKPGEPLADYNKRAHQVYEKRFREIKGDSFDRVVKLLGYLKRLGMPRELWPKEMEIRNITGEGGDPEGKVDYAGQD